MGGESVGSEILTFQTEYSYSGDEQSILFETSSQNNFFLEPTLLHKEIYTWLYV